MSMHNMSDGKVVKDVPVARKVLQGGWGKPDTEVRSSILPAGTNCQVLNPKEADARKWLGDRSAKADGDGGVTLGKKG